MKLTFIPLLFLGFTAPANAATIFEEDFDGPISTAIGGAGNVASTQGYAGLLGFSGSFYRNDTTGSPQATTDISLTGIGAHTSVTVSFSLALIDSWDGSALQDDAFVVRESGNELLRLVIDPFLGLSGATFPSGVTNPIAPTALAFSTGIPTQNDRDTGASVSLTFAHTASTLDLTFGAEGSAWSGGVDESWAFDSVSITTAAIPLPAGLPLLAGALGLLAITRRRRT